MTDTAEQARLLDVSRLVSRVGRGAWTGVDRVEAAYLTRLLQDDTPLFGVVRSSGGYSLFDRAGLLALSDRLSGSVPWGRAAGVDRFRLRADPRKRRAETDLRRLCVARSGASGLGAMLAAWLAPGTRYLNTGHSNLHPHMFAALDVAGARKICLIHDTIPLDHPDWQRPGTVASFEARLRAVAIHADLVIHTAQATRTQTETHFTRFGRVPLGVVAPLGIDEPPVDAVALPPDLGINRPYFVALGTIEPRKNHALLLELWSALGARVPDKDMPQLVIIGRRGWQNQAVFDRLDARPAHIHELGPLPDGAVGALLTGARALLMPSFAEGFGLPPGEALALGCPVIASDLPVYREVFGNNIVYLDPHDLYSWTEQIMAFAGNDRGTRAGISGLPDWETHFNLVLKAL